MEHSLHNKIKIESSISDGTVITSGADGAVHDTRGFESLEDVLHVGTVFVGGALAVVLEESDVVTFGGEETVVSADETLGALPAIGATQASGSVMRVGSIGKKRYQRCTLVGTSTSGSAGVVAILGHPKNAPTDAQAS